MKFKAFDISSNDMWREIEDNKKYYQELYGTGERSYYRTISFIKYFEGEVSIFKYNNFEIALPKNYLFYSEHRKYSFILNYIDKMFFYILIPLIKINKKGYLIFSENIFIILQKFLLYHKCNIVYKNNNYITKNIKIDLNII